MRSSTVTVLSADDQRRAPYSLAWKDLATGFRRVELWGSMGWFDIRQRYSRSVIGPFWITLSLAGFVLALGTTYATLFRQPILDFLPYVTIGIVIWTFIAVALSEGCNVFSAAEVAVKQMPAPLSVHVYRVVWRGLIVLAHNAVIVVIALLAKPLELVFGLLPALAGVAVIALNAVAVSLALGTLGARFRDLPPLMTNIIALLFFVTPILWRVENLGDRAWIALVNPIYHFVELVRAPLLGGHVAPMTWLVVLAVTAVNLAAAFLLYARFRSRIPYWL
ncbi:ABC transporter permease [uncultured Enterovirga sp.]|uniref:ABC transporter permease n=1 Tax=uncultured Enterovirga sp. TaxID=2026352 RepID=UPI0035CC2204